MKFELRPYQGDAIRAAWKEYRGGLNRLLIKKPTGTGKTVMFAAIPKWPEIAEWLGTFPKNERKMLVIAHREELLDQAASKILAQNPELRVDIEQADRYASRFSDVVVASIQTLQASKFRRMKRLLQQHTFRVVIVDEAHHAAADSYRTALSHLGFLPKGMSSDGMEIEAPKFDDVAKMREALDGWDAVAPKDRLLIGVTATPNRSDAIGLGCVFQSISYSYALKDAIDDGWLTPIVPWVIETATNLDGVKLSHGDFNQKQLAEAVNNDIRNKLAVAGWLEHAPGLPTIAFTVDVDHAHALAAEFCRQGIKARAISGETPRHERRETLRAYTLGEIQVITNCMVLTEGTDLPLTGCILHAAPTRSATLYEQKTGRGLRIHPGKKECILLDVVDIARKHSLQTAPVLYGLPPTLECNGRPLAQTAEEIEALLEKHPGFNLDRPERFTLKQLEAMARTFDIWNIRPMGDYAKELSLTWTRTDEEAFAMSYPWLEGHERVEVKADILGRFDVTVQPRFKDPVSGLPNHGDKRTIAAGVVGATPALKLAEAFVQSERSQVLKIMDVDAPWKRRPASKGQLGLLRSRGIPFNPKGLTMGQASALIDNANLRRS